MATYYTPRSAALVGTSADLVCDSRGFWTVDDGEVKVPCAGQVRMVWLHSGHGDWEATACEAFITRIQEAMPRVSPRLGYSHAIYRDQTGTWQLNDDAAQVDGG